MAKPKSKMFSVRLDPDLHEKIMDSDIDLRKFIEATFRAKLRKPICPSCGQQIKKGK